MTTKQVFLILRVVFEVYRNLKIPKVIYLSQEDFEKIWVNDPLKLELEKEISSLDLLSKRGRNRGIC